MVNEGMKTFLTLLLLISCVVSVVIVAFAIAWELNKRHRSP